MTSFSTTLYRITNHFDKAELISSTLTIIVPLISLVNPPSHPKPVNSDITSFNTLGNQEYDFTTTVTYFLLIRDDSSNSFSLVRFGTNT